MQIVNVYKNPPDPECCHAKVTENDRMANRHQCMRKWKKEYIYKGNKFCHTHYPPNIKQKSDDWEKNFRKKLASDNAQGKREANAERLVGLVKNLPFVYPFGNWCPFCMKESREIRDEWKGKMSEEDEIKHAHTKKCEFVKIKKLAEKC